MHSPRYKRDQRGTREQLNRSNSTMTISLVRLTTRSSRPGQPDVCILRDTILDWPGGLPAADASQMGSL